MKLRRRVIIVCFCLVAWNCFGEAEKTAVVAGPEPSLQESMEEQEGDWVAAHESNGPEGAQGVPMRRLPRMQAGLAVLVLLAGGSLALLVEKKRPGTKYPHHE